MTRRKKKIILKSPYKELMDVISERSEIIKCMIKEKMIKNEGSASYFFHPLVLECQDFLRRKRLNPEGALSVCDSPNSDNK